ncbi:MAG: hypothetical protein KKD39_08755 [Candidatus Altiarchaeota archaeon]|nr:hypothetical protein [Candidatus Altiarchaeota archaeon]
MASPVAGIRLDYLLNICKQISSSGELAQILGVPVEKHIALLVQDGRFKFTQLTPFGDQAKAYSPEEQAMAQSIVDKIIKSNYPGQEGLPGVR